MLQYNLLASAVSAVERKPCLASVVFLLEAPSVLWSTNYT